MFSINVFHLCDNENYWTFEFLFLNSIEENGERGGGQGGGNKTHSYLNTAK